MILDKLGQIKISNTKIIDLPRGKKLHLAILGIGVWIMISLLIWALWALLSWGLATLLCLSPFVLLMIVSASLLVRGSFRHLRLVIREFEVEQTRAQALQAAARAPFPEEWAKLIIKKSSLYRRLPEQLKTKLHQLINLFLYKIDFAPLEGEEPPIEITEEMRVLVAAEASVLILNLRTDPIECINLYDVVKKVHIAQNLIDGNVVGQWRSNASLVLVWPYTIDDSKTSEDKSNVTIHEFAHALDSAADSKCDGNPFELKEKKRRGKHVEIQLFDGRAFEAKEIESANQWQEIIDAMHEDLEKIYKLRGGNNVISEYGSTNPTEFFAVATEVYFDQPKNLQKVAPDVYRLINLFYELDPAEWPRGN